MKRREVYWDNYRDQFGRDRRVPMLIVSSDAYNEGSLFVTAVRLVHNDARPMPQHINIPADAFTQTAIIGDSVALCETVSSVRKTSLEGPIALLDSNYYMSLVEDGIKVQCGMLSPVQRNPVYAPPVEQHIPMYTGYNSPQMRETHEMRMEEV